MADNDLHNDDLDVPAALAQVTEDGPGELENLPESDFVSYATDEVEKQEDSK